MRFITVLHTWLLLLLAIATVPSVSAGLFANSPFSQTDPLDVEQAFVFDYRQDGNNLQLIWDMPEGYYLYRDRIEIAENRAVAVLERSNSTAKQKDDPLFGQVWVYYKFAEVNLTLGSKTTGTTEESVIQVTYQGCWEGGICYPPVTKDLQLTVPPQAEAAATGKSEAMVPTAAKQAVVSAPVVAAELSEQDQFAAMLRDGNLAVTLGAFFIAGLALSFTPCVFPMIPILSSIIAGQGQRVTAATGFWLSLVYVLAVSVTYTIAGVFAGLFGESLQVLFQNPWVISSFSLIFVLLALSMFGFYELQLPNSLQSKLSSASNNQQGGTVTGVAIMGFLSALIVGPCMAAPLAGALIYIGQTGDPVLGGSALFTMSIGMGVPLLLVGTSAGKLLPHAGLWMDRVKSFFGILLLLLAIWMLDRVVPAVVTMWLTAIVLTMAAVFMGALSSSEKKAHGLSLLGRGAGIIVLIYAAALMVGALSGSKSMLYPLKGVAGAQAMPQNTLPFIKVTTQEQLQQALSAAKAKQQPVMLDFYADWCPSCVELDVVTFADSKVQKSLDEFYLIKVDVTANDSAARALNKSYSLVGPPALIFYDRQGNMMANKTLIGFVSPVDFINHISGI